MRVFGKVHMKHVHKYGQRGDLLCRHAMGNWLHCMHASQHDNACKDCCNVVCEQMTMSALSNDSPILCFQGVQWRQPGVISQLKTIAEAAKVRWPWAHPGLDHCLCAHCSCGCLLHLMLATHD